MPRDARERRTGGSAGLVVAIDGPAGSGKSTTAQRVAKKLGFLHLDTGAMYRATALKCLVTGQDLADRRGLVRMLARTRIDMEWRSAGYRVRLDGRDVSREIRRPRVSALVSEVSAIPAVRHAMVVIQRRVAAGRNVVCEGRDIGSVVFPEARLKVFLDCDIVARTARRKRELAGQHVALASAAVRANLRRRDRIDSSRRMSPLRRVADAVLVDTTDLSIEDQVDVVCALARRRSAAPS